MGALHVKRTLATFLGLASITVALFGVVALVALQTGDRLAWVSIPQLGPDLGLDAGLHTKPLKSTVIADAVRDRRIEGDGSLTVTAVMAPKGDPLTAMGPTARPVIPAVVVPDPTPAPTPAPTPSPSPVATPAPTPAP